MTTRKTAATAAGAILSLLFLGGCATPGLLHVYTVESGLTPPAAPADALLAVIQDLGPDHTIEVPSFVQPNDGLTGFAYDPFTDHFFLRLAPGNHFRVVDRPARAIKREFTIPELASSRGGDLAIRPRDGHVFALEPPALSVVEFTRYGGFVRRFALESLPSAPAGIAYDSAADRLLVLTAGSPARVTTHSTDGRLISALTLNQPVTAGSLAYDSEAREYYVPLPDGHSVGVFGADGQLRRTVAVTATFLDVGPRSFLRMF